jgi:drug/metabolite transporter (DMT)-like permease
MNAGSSVRAGIAVATPFRENLIGIAAIAFANFVFLLNDTLVKVVGASLPLGEILFFRGLFASFGIAAIVLASGLHQQLGGLWRWSVFWRTFAEVTAAFLYLFALIHMPIANINAILQVVPLMITAAGAIFFAERVGWRRWTAISIGFLGVLIIMRPGLAGFDVYGLVALASMAFITLRDMATRAMPRGLSAMLVALATAAAVGLSGLGLGLTEQWVAPDVRSLAMLLGAAILVVLGYLTSVKAMRHGDISVVAPFRYTVVIFAILIGFIVWGDVPDLAMIVGTAIIIATGVYTFHRERKVSLDAVMAPADDIDDLPIKAMSGKVDSTFPPDIAKKRAL